jgi:UDP-3-O-[3-hydroxymyristoyl] glucosamine N-acyltransferase
VVTLTKPKLKVGYKYAKHTYMSGFQVPVNVEVGKGVVLGWDCESIGEGCVIGPGVRLDSSLGTSVTIGENANIKSCKLGNNLAIGSKSRIEAGAIIEDDVSVGSNVHIGRNCHVRKGTVIPDNWMIPNDCIVNPGTDGAPVVIVQPTFRCNVQGNIRAGNGY